MKNPHAQAMGSLGGKSTSEAKIKASKENGKKGGYPKGRPRKPKQQDETIIKTKTISSLES
jgi:hypothetical protein